MRNKELLSLAQSPAFGIRKWSACLAKVGQVADTVSSTDAWLPTIIFLQTDGPRFKKGFISAFVAAMLALVGAPLIHYLALRDRRAAQREQDEVAPSVDLPEKAE